MSSTYDVLGDPTEYEEWLASKQPPAPPLENKQNNVAQRINDLPEELVHVVSQLDQQYIPIVLSAFQQLQLSRQDASRIAANEYADAPVSFERGSGTSQLAVETSKSSRSMARWQTQQAVWARQQGSISQKMQRPVPDLAMSAVRAAEWRDKKELIGTLEAAIPYTERGAGGADVWPLQLRDNWTRHVPLGNMFSGLFVEIKEKTCAEQAAQLVAIRRPELLEPHLFPASAPGGLPISAGAATTGKARRRSWASSDYLAQRLQHFSAHLKEVQPHQPEAVAVQGTSVHPAHLSATITLDDLAASLRLEQGEVATALMKARDSLQEHARLQQHKQAKEAAAAAALLAAEKAQPKGPLMELSHQRLLFECASGTSASAVLTITNTGSTALYYRWERIAHHPHQQQMSVQFHLSDQNGAVLPGALHTFCFRFSPSANGMHTETWVLHTHPSTPQGPSPVVLRGAAVEPNVLGRECRKMAAMLADREKSAKVSAALERILADVAPAPKAAPTWSAEQQQEESAFNSANVTAKSAVYYSPDAYNDLAALYSELLQAIAASAPPVVEVKKGAKAAKAAPSPQTPVFSEQWDASLDTLTAVQQQLTAQDSTAGDRFSLRLNDLKQALLVPQHRQVLHRHAIRLLLQQAADSIDTVADAVKQACIEKEQQRIAAAAPAAPSPKGGKAAATAVPPPPTYNAAELRHDSMAPVQQVVRDTLDQIPAAVQSEEHSVANCLQQQLVQAQARLRKQAEPQAAVQETWDVFHVLRSESALRLSQKTQKLTS